MAIFYVKNVLSSGDFSIFMTKLTQKAAPHCRTASAYYKTIRLSPLIFY